MNRLLLVFGAVGCLLLVAAAPGASSRAAFSGPTVDDLVTKCPPAAEVAAIRADFSLSFEGDLTAGSLECRAADGSADLTRLQERAIQSLRVMKALSFARPLPWTSQGLYDWLNGAIDGIRFRNDIEYSFCCSPARVMNIQTRNLAALMPGNRWQDPQGGSGLSGLVGLFIHEARHSEGLPHTCGPWDATLAEMGSIGVTYYYWVWTGLHGGQFLSSPSPSPSYYRDWAIGNSEGSLASICTLPAADLALSVEPAPSQTPAGSTLQLTLRATNQGPDTAPAAYVFLDETQGVAVVQSASASQGSCVVGVEGEPRGTSCDLGSLASGATATVAIVQRVTGKAGQVVEAPVSNSTLGPYVTGPVRDGNRQNNRGRFSITISAALAQTTCPGTPKGGVKKTGPADGGRVVGTSRGDVLCSGGGATRVEGRGGDDVLRGGPGPDTVLAGPGNDRIYVRGGGADSVACGPGRDYVVADRADRVAGDCKSVKRA